MKELLKKWKDWQRRPFVSVLFSVVACLLLPYAYSCMVEFVRIGSVYYTLSYLSTHFVQMALGVILIILLFAAVTVATARPWVANLIVGGVLCLASWVNLQKLIYRAEPLLPKDLLQAGAALEISEELSYSFPRESWLFLLLLALSTALLWYVKLPFGKSLRSRFTRAGLSVLLLAGIPVYTAGVIYNEEFMLSQGVYVNITSLADTYYKGGFVTGFSMLTHGMLGIEKPENYSLQTVLQAADLVEWEEASTSQKRCNVVVVLLESYYDLLNYDTAVFGEPLNENFKRIAEEGISGEMLSEKYGGGTANIEFSVLTGYSNSFLPVGSVPYVEYINTDFLCYPQFLKENGYQTLALHPYKRTFYSRESTYSRMGFDAFVTQEAFTEDDIIGNYIGDQAAFDKALELYREAAQNGPVFLHIVTMQNHVPNQPGEYPADYAVRAFIEGENEYSNACLSSVATGLRDTDRAIGSFVDALREETDDVVVLFFGDHQTDIKGEDGEDLLSHMASYNALSADQKILRSHVTPYLMWANFDIKEQGIDGGLLPSYLLLPTMLHEYNVLRPAWMDWMYATNPILGELSFDLYFTEESTRETKMTQEQKSLYAAQELLQYDLMFGKGYSIDKLYRISEPNV